MSTAILWDKHYLLHDTGAGHPEKPARLSAIREALDLFPHQKKLITLQPRAATVEEISRVHDSAYVCQVQKLAGGSGWLDGDTAFSPQSWEAASLAVGGLLESVDAVIAGRAANAFAFVRPPGHHAEQGHAMGFCLFNNIAIAAEHALQKYGLSRIAIMDFDVHHGNGTQWAFYERADVFYLSTHRYPFYPGTGAETDAGRGAGKGFTLNVELSGGDGDEELLRGFEKRIIPAMRAYQPELVLVSAGFDAHRLDPLGGLNVTAPGFAEISRQLLDVARASCGGKAVFVLEGGYSLEGLKESVTAVLTKMAD